jgi:uncharacterized membrane protein YphA (DoxX/SURF4 family)
MNIALWIVQLVLGLAFIAFGSTKVQYEKALVSLPWVKDTSKGLTLFVGSAELLGGLGVIVPGIIGIWTSLIPLAALGIAIIMIFAAVFHAKRKEYKAIIMNLILLILALFVAYGRY